MCHVDKFVRVWKKILLVVFHVLFYFDDVWKEMSVCLGVESEQSERRKDLCLQRCLVVYGPSSPAVHGLRGIQIPEIILVLFTAGMYSMCYSSSTKQVEHVLNISGIATRLHSLKARKAQTCFGFSFTHVSLQEVKLSLCCFNGSVERCAIKVKQKETDNKFKKKDFEAYGSYSIC